MTKIVGYARVSPIGQGLEVQLEQLKSAGATKVFKETTSGANRDRPQLQALLKHVNEGDTVVVSKLDRIAGNTRQLLEIVENLREAGVAFRVLNSDIDTSTPIGKQLICMIGVIAEFEKEMMLERQAEGIARAKKEGRYKGRKPTARAKTDDVLRLTKEGLTKQKIADELNIGVASVYRILKNQSNMKLKDNMPKETAVKIKPSRAKKHSQPVEQLSFF